MTSSLHEERLQAVHDALAATGARRVLDLGCGDGDLFVRLAADARFEALVGVDLSASALERLKGRLASVVIRTGQIELRCASMIEPAADLVGYDCAILVETIEHLDPGHLSRLERTLLHRLRPRWAIITTPNAEFNRLLGVPSHRFRHPDHRFEWGRAKFCAWAGRAARAGGYEVTFADIAGHHPDLGGASQMAILRWAGA